ncbi:MAG: sigma-54 dependent transcriptional regulator [Candidatus Marinimicrobia bacterium]|nr:sigma-54 dependent transcriptional regulator [Candidatus Neomarinimicrobiota bacterium]
MGSNILIADKNKDTVREISDFLQSHKYVPYQANDGEEALELLKNNDFDILIVNVDLPNRTGVELLDKASTICPKSFSIVISEKATVKSAIEALKKGAIDFFIKPIDMETLLIRLKSIKKYQQTLLENRYLRKEVHSKFNHHDIIGESKAMQKVYKLIDKVSDSSSNVLITGRSGTGKELVARAIHQNSSRKEKPFVPINCGAIPDNLFESELFGFKKGSFTGARTSKEGVFKAAHTGTLFLDEVGEIPINIQVKLLRAIEMKEIKPIGVSSTRKVDCRILSATNKNLLKEIEEGNFREDLYYRLNIVEIHLPPLSKRRDDIPLLIDYFIHKYNKELNRNMLGVDNKAMKLLMNYEWKGQVRELENVIERAVLLAEGDYITPEDLPPHTCQDDYTGFPDDLKESVKKFERRHISSILRKTENDKTTAAEKLNIGLSSLYRKIDELEIEA